MCVCVYTHERAHTHTHTHTNTHTHTHKYNTRTHGYTHTHRHTHPHAHTCTYTTDKFLTSLYVTDKDGQPLVWWLAALRDVSRLSLPTVCTHARTNTHLHTHTHTRTRTRTRKWMMHHCCKRTFGTPRHLSARWCTQPPTHAPTRAHNCIPRRRRP